jgi:hypothetical protein
MCFGLTNSRYRRRVFAALIGRRGAFDHQTREYPPTFIGEVFVTTVISIAAAEASAEWKALTPKQKAWIGFFVQSNDGLAATKLVYAVKSDRNARSLMYEMQRNPRVTAVLGLLAGLTEREIFLEGLKDGIRRAKKGSVAYVRAMSLFAHAAGIIAGNVPDEDDDESGIDIPVDKIVERAGKFYRVTLVEVSKSDE